MKFSVKNFFNKCKQIHIKLLIYSHLLNKSLTENFMFLVVNIFGFTTESCKFFSKLIASLTCTLHQSTLDTDFFFFSFALAVNNSTSRLTLVLHILVISTWLGVWLVNCIQFSWIIVVFFILMILTKFLAYTFFLENISPSPNFVIQKHPNFYDFHLKNSSLWEIGRYMYSPGASQRYWQNWNVCIIVYYYYLGFYIVPV